MALPLQLTVTESIPELRAHQRRHGELIGKRLQMLIEIKRHELAAISPKKAFRHYRHQSQQYRQMAQPVLEARQCAPTQAPAHRRGQAKCYFTWEPCPIGQKLNDPQNGIQGYTELRQWVKDNLSLDIRYITLLK